MDIHISGVTVRVGRTSYIFDNDSDAEAFADCVGGGGDIAKCAETYRCKETVNFPTPPKR